MTFTRAKTKKCILSKTTLASVLFFTLIISVAHMQTQNLSIIAYGPAAEELLEPLGVGNVISANNSASQNKNDIPDNDSDIKGNVDMGLETNNCIMPPCPPGHACIQSCL